LLCVVSFSPTDIENTGHKTKHNTYVTRATFEIAIFNYFQCPVCPPIVFKNHFFTNRIFLFEWRVLKSVRTKLIRDRDLGEKRRRKRFSKYEREREKKEREQAENRKQVQLVINHYYISDLQTII
jgi:hypothetical protein